MTTELNNQDLFQPSEQILEILDIYHRTALIYSQTKYALGHVPIFQFSYSLTNVGKVNYGRVYSTKIYERK